MHERLLFLRKFLQFGIRIASVTPSSRALVSAVIAPIEWGRARTVIELGAGTGPITEQLIEKAPSSCLIVVVENDHDFVNVLREKYGNRQNIKILEMDATDLDCIAREAGIEKADYVVSGLPVPSLSLAAQKRLFSSLERVLTDGGSFIQITEIPLVFQRFYKKHFESVVFTLVLANLPPGGVYVCRRLIRPVVQG